MRLTNEVQITLKLTETKCCPKDGTTKSWRECLWLSINLSLYSIDINFFYAAVSVKMGSSKLFLHVSYFKAKIRRIDAMNGSW